MIVWVEIESAPRIALYREDGAIPHLDTKAARFRNLGALGDIQRPFSLLSPAESASVDIDLTTNQDLYDRWFQDPPLKKGVGVYAFETRVRVLFTGTIMRLELFPVMRIFAEA